MVTLATKTYHPFEFMGLSTDTKPITKYGDEPLKNGDRLMEMDTGNVFFYDEESGTWIAPED